MNAPYSNYFMWSISTIILAIGFAIAVWIVVNAVAPHSLILKTNKDVNLIQQCENEKGDKISE